MWKFIKNLFGVGTHSFQKGQRSATKDDDIPTKYTIRLGKSVRVDEAFEVWTSGDLPRMLGALETKTNLIDRHFLLMGIVEQTYKERKDPSMMELCKKISELHISEFPKIAPALKKDMGGTLPRVTTFQYYATLLTESGDYEKAIEMCQKALSFGLHDGTKSGFEGRIARIKKQMSKRRNT